MQIHRSTVEITIQTPAKLNLLFEVLGKREDGYHEIESLMCPVDLFDTLCFREEPSGRIELACRWADPAGENGRAGRDPLPQGSENLVYRAVELIRLRTGTDRGATLVLTKRIPMAAGLGGGSSDAAAALMAANLGWNLGLSTADLMGLAARLGSDVPFFLVGGPAVCRGRGELVEPVTGLGAMHFVLARPPVGLSTATVYRACHPAEKPRSVEPLVESLRAGDVAAAGRLLGNQLQPAAEGLSEWIPRLREAFDREDFLGHAMSGSGTSYFGLCRHARHARRVARRLQSNGVGNVFAVRSCR
jgi:4-diphosphocytidyl-2-C-methyl-D-erythritol kinase